jgi:ATP-dependent DNA helicase
MAPQTATPSTEATPARSTPPSSPPSDSKDGNILAKKEEGKGNQIGGVDLEDDEDMDHKSKALTNLLKTSSVFVAIMADKMKEQQKRNREEARRAAVRKRNAEARAGTAASEPSRKSSRMQNTTATGGSAHDSTSGEKKQQQQLPARGRGRPPNKKNGPGGKKNIMDYMNKDEVDLEEGPTVQEALAEAADEYEGENLGAQELVATEQPQSITGGKMKEYQLEGLEWLKTLWMNGLCGILADEMGLGKTLQALSMIAFFKDNNISGPFLIAAPLSTVRNWIEEFKFWAPSINTVLYHGSKDEREEIRRKQLKMSHQGKPDFPVVVTSYEIVMNDRKFLANYQWRYIIVDEGHRLKNMNCRLIKELMSYNSANRLLLTGTPLQNNIAELWSLLHFLLPEVFNDLDNFERWFDFSSVLDDKNDEEGKTSRRKNNLVGTMHAILKPFLLRRVKTDVESSLPKKREYILYAPLTAEQKDLYREILAGTSRTYLEDKAVERIVARSLSRPSSLKRKANDSGRSTPAKSLKPTRASTPASVVSVATEGSVRRGRKANRNATYRDITDGEFNSKLRRLERGNEDVDLNTADGEGETSTLDSSEDEELQRAETLKLAKREIANKKLQNPIMQARLACNSPHNFYWPWGPSTQAEAEAEDYPEVDETLVTASGKMLLLDTLLPRLFKLGHKVLIFSQFKTTLDILETYASQLRGWTTCRIDGSVAQEDRYEQITSFNTDKKTQLFLLSTRAGGQGINLTAADTVVLFDSDWNPQQDLQAMDRAHRIGQTRPVIVYRLATRGTVEETLLLKAEGKRKLEKLVIQKGKFKSLIDGVDGGKGKLSKTEAEELKGVLQGEDWERYDVGQEGKEILSEKELGILTDRSDKAYERAEKGLDVGGDASSAFKVAETKRGEGDVLADLTTTKKRQ